MGYLFGIINNCHELSYVRNLDTAGHPELTKQRSSEPIMGVGIRQHNWSSTSHVGIASSKGNLTKASSCMPHLLLLASLKLTISYPSQHLPGLTTWAQSEREGKRCGNEKRCNVLLWIFFWEWVGGKNEFQKIVNYFSPFTEKDSLPTVPDGAVVCHHTWAASSLVQSDICNSHFRIWT